MDSVENIRRGRHFTRTYIELTIHTRGITQSERRRDETFSSPQHHVT
ncbi:hypothetical protein LK429_02325 [Hoylesella buccalis]|nr:hypothetical protein [Hoylesella buccalis]UEA63439.1 hypothetical protein LK429_02325 [Hoylesella buccalis]UWP49270.1 hypothetical protein NQ518_12305 [Hoylesella buccalis ATCC 35310]